jgi:tRNA(Ile)-lysidine synthase
MRLALAELTGSTRELHFTPLEQLLDALPEHSHAGGPHTLVAGLAWSVVAGAGGAHLSIHRADATPASARGPQLAPGGPPRPIAPPDRLTAGGWTLSCRSMTDADLPEDWRSPEWPWRAFVDADQISAVGMRLIAWSEAPAGARFTPLGLGGRHKQIGNLFTDHKIPPAHRRGWPLIIDGATQEILWVCGLQPSHVGRITATTQQVIEICWSEHEKE